MRHALFFAGAAVGIALCASCKDGWPQRAVPSVEQALRQWDAGQSQAARDVLIQYLHSGSCEAPPPPSMQDTLRAHPPAAYDFALLLSELAEGPDAKSAEQRRCVAAFARELSADLRLPADIRARAAYLLGNLHFSDKRYDDAIKAYDLALAWQAPSSSYGSSAADGGDGTLEERAAYNRALALRELSTPPDGGDGGGGDGGDGGEGDAGSGDGGGSAQAPSDGASETPPAGEAGAPPPERVDQSPSDPGATEQTADQRVLDALENAPMFEVERMRKQKRKPRTTDK